MTNHLFKKKTTHESRSHLLVQVRREEHDECRLTYGEYAVDMSPLAYIYKFRDQVTINKYPTTKTIKTDALLGQNPCACERHSTRVSVVPWWRESLEGAAIADIWGGMLLCRTLRHSPTQARWSFCICCISESRGEDESRGIAVKENS